LASDMRWFLGSDRISAVQSSMLLSVINVPIFKICDKLSKQLSSRIVSDIVLSMARTSEGFKVFTSAGKEFLASEIISTIPFDAFAKIFPEWDPGNKIRCENSYFSIEDYCGNTSSITYPKDNPKVAKIVENSFVKKRGVEYRKAIPNKSCIYKATKFFGRINPPPEGVTFVGRFASGNPHWRIEDSIFLAKNGTILSKFLSEQSRFAVALNEVRPASDEQRARSVILHLYSEVGELLREINWKEHVRTRTTVKATNVLEESIDCIKLLFDVLARFNYTDREIVNAFNDKSKRVWNKFLNEFYGGV